eukprot:SM000057S18338  [mRNA]  locus=s57:68892:71142:- [translate_table: standard]
MHGLALLAAEVAVPAAEKGTEEPLLVRAIQGEKVERPPVWAMRQAGRYMKPEVCGRSGVCFIHKSPASEQVYQELCEKHPTFRERSENVELAVEVSLQPWRAFRPDGVILFSDILTPLTGMNIPFDILKTKGPVVHKPIRTAADVAEVQDLVPEEAVPYVGQALTELRREVGNESAVLGFVGAPFTLASYIVEGGSSKNFTIIKRMAFEAPEVLHSLLEKLADSITTYIRYQADSGAQAVQIFDSWATHLHPTDFEIFSLPYLKQIVSSMKSSHPDLPIILYASGSGGLLERMASTGVDVVSIDWTVDMAEARQRIGQDLAVQGNVDPAGQHPAPFANKLSAHCASKDRLILFGPKHFIERRIHETVAKAGTHKHVLNLGHGVLVGTPEESVAHFFEVGKSIRY